ncbi:AAA family ATPase [uncultured Nostoc sp.]|uniref:AAA family ATPase n=1 Tax=uncultured Nostoc sp. TaxID=340711 RepID=UPI0035CBB5A6
MSTVISQFNVNSLHGYRTIKVPIKDNKIVLVGENGTGKSTVANLFYYFITCQWAKIAEFQDISIIINDKEITVNKEQIDFYIGSKNLFELQLKVPRSLLVRLEREKHILEQDPLELLDEKETIKLIASSTKVPIRLVEEFIKTKLKEDSPQLELLKKTESELKKLVNFQVVYLPTYRRIEQDLKSILPELELEIRNFRERGYARRKSSNYIEIIEFGMEDVEATINRKLEKLKDSFITELNNLTGTYLRDVIRETYQDVEVEKLQGLDSSTIDSIFGRIDEKILPKQDQQSLRDFIIKIQKEKNIENIENERKVIAYFILKLIDLQQTQKSQEQDVRDFIRICNKYLVGKEIFYDSTNFQIPIICKQKMK